MLDQFIRVVLWLHIASGFTAFFVAPVALITRKGGDTHRRWGKIYFWAMTVAAVSSIVVAAYRPNLFLLLVGIFAFYLAFSGYRVLARKRPDKGQNPTALDWSVTAITLLASLAMIIWGATNLVTGTAHLNTVLIVFGIAGTLSAGSDMKTYVRPSKDKNAWYFDHMSGMVASYIAAVSAFAVVNLTFLPPLVRWLGPTAIGVPLLSFWIGYYKRKFHHGKRPEDVALIRESALLQKSA